MMSRFPAAFRPPAFASWSSCARQGTGPSLRSAYRSLLPGPDPDGVATFRAHELRPGWGRVAGARYRAPAPSEPDKPVFRASRLKQAQRLTGRQKSLSRARDYYSSVSRSGCV